MQGALNSQSILKKKNKVGNSHFPISKLTIKLQLSKRNKLTQGQTYRLMGEKIKGPKINPQKKKKPTQKTPTKLNPHIYDHLIILKGAKTIQWGRDPSINGTTRYPHTKELNWTLTSYLTKNYIKMD